MSSTTSPKDTLNYRHVLAAARNMAAAQFALHGFDLLEQVGHAFYFYDLGVASTEGMMKIMVHGSLDGLWRLVEPYLLQTRSRKNDYHRAIDLWLERYRHVTCCLVQFDSQDLNGMPRIYLASAAEVAEILHEHAESLGEMAVPAGDGSAVNFSWEERLPRRWQFSQARIAELMSAPEGRRPANFRIPAAEVA